ncbi:ABC transporter permease [Alcaligenes nematophilus]|uniref:ABC transporter permease n=1 Tax=Alcaligenes nematophilus TaxID=2994643 RepID=UPI002464C6F9|nr:ABC transporter permease [Alcaligenes nematophilus]MDH4865644.1 ABC transporter permease [Bacillus cereus]MDY7126942.1 ABC transporter permease [Alcaligenes nematophilus]
MTEQVRSPMAVTWSVWRALFLREALDRLFDMRAAWFWLLMEPVLHIGFMTFVFTVIRMRTVGGIDVMIWIVVGMLAFFTFRRTAMQVMHAVASNKPLFAYRQVQPFDAAIVRGVLEAFLMVLVSILILITVALLGHDVVPDEPLQVLAAMCGLWFFGVGYGLVASVLMALVRETEHILKILMMPLYLMSGVIMPISAVPQPYRDMLLLNPLVHGLELVRQGFSTFYHVVPGISMSYLYLWGVASLFLGLVLFRRFALQLVMK